jgi:large subunit ribosomal protein L24
MERVLRRTALAKNQATRRARILEEKRTIRDRVQFRLQNSLLHKENTATIRSARKNRREDWELGPIAPWRAAAAYATVAGNVATGGAATGSGPATGENGLQRDEFFGTFSARRLNPPKVPEKYRVKDWFIREGDRVVVAEGREGLKGKIGKIKSLDKEAETVILEGINMVCFAESCGMQLVEATEANIGLSQFRSTFAYPPRCKHQVQDISRPSKHLFPSPP